MSKATASEEKNTDNVDSLLLSNKEAKTHQTRDNSKKRKRSKKKTFLAKVNSTVMMWTRRIHLFSGLFMLPWVLLYGFTAMLFNHSTWFSDSQIESVSIDSDQLDRLPVSKNVAQQVVSSLVAEGIAIELTDHPNAEFTRSAVASYEDDESSTSLIIDLNSGSAYQRIRKKSEASKKTDVVDDNDKEPTPKSLAKGIAIQVDPGDVLDATEIVTAVSDKKQEKPVKLQSIPILEFDAIVDGEAKRLRFSQQSQRRRGRGTQQPKTSTSESGKSIKPHPTKVRGTVTSIGDNPRDMSWRSYFLRLHLAHGYPVTKNARYWWAYAVDAMFVCMVFWGFSGVFMWWQIKRTRVIGFVLLLASFFTAAYLAYAMHWQLVNG